MTSLPNNSSVPHEPQAMRRGLHLLAQKQLPDQGLMAEIVHEIMSGQTSPAHIGGLLMGIALLDDHSAFGQTLTGAVQAMREAVPIPIRCKRTPLIDTCGTGGSGVPRKNVSTAVAIAVAACGIGVAKHGNRGISSPCGSADVLQALGMNLNCTPEQISRCIEEIGVGFLFAPKLHPAMAYVAGPRRDLGVRTIFNLLGPLINPAGVQRQVIGVFDARRCQNIAETLGKLGSQRIFVVHGWQKGLDDLSCEGESLVVEWFHGELRQQMLQPAMAGLQAAPLAELMSKPSEGAQSNAEAMRNLFAGEQGAYRTSVQYSGALALLVASDEDFTELPEMAARIGEVLDNGKAMDVLNRLIAFSQTFKNKNPEQAA